MDAARRADFHEPAAGLSLPQPYLLFLGDSTEANFAKTAFGLRDWASDVCVAEFALPGCTVTTNLPHLSPKDAYARALKWFQEHL